MKKRTEWIKDWFFPAMSRETKNEIDSLNVTTIHYVSLVVGVVQLISLIIFFIINHNRITDTEVIGAAIRVGLSVFLCLLGYFIAGSLMKRPDAIQQHPMGVKVFIGGFVILLIIWSMYVSVWNYINHQQLLTFYTVELILVLFVKLHPAFTTTVIFGSYILNYLILNFGFEEGVINPYNYLMFAALSVVGAIMNYRMTVGYISEKNKANLLNDSLEIIANHDSITRLQNRYALNQHVPDYIGKDICIAIGDINSFKAVNDTYGHRVGDDVLKGFADILVAVFPADSVFRFGGDEFLIIEKNNDLDGLNAKLRQVNERFSTLKISDVDSKLGCCFGCVTACPKDPAEFFEYLTQADQLLYQEKQKINAKR